MAPHTIPRVTERFTLRRLSENRSGFADDVRNGLTAIRKSTPPRWFYDELGSALFEAICRLPEYYLTRAETEILTRSGSAIAAAAGDIEQIVELGSGSARKTRILLDAFASRPIEYLPVDIDASTLQKSGRDLIADYPNLTVTASAADFGRPSRALRELRRGRTLVLFLGSTIGNLERNDAVVLLRDLRSVLEPGDSLLLGVDLKKDRKVLDAAYDDVLGVTAAFNLNLLQRMNRELGGHFNLENFAHRAFYDEAAGRVEMHLVSLREQTVRIDSLALEIAFAEGETIHTENSWKYDLEGLEALASGSGFRVARSWSDSQGLFTDLLMAAV